MGEEEKNTMYIDDLEKLMKNQKTDTLAEFKERCIEMNKSFKTKTAWNFDLKNKELFQSGIGSSKNGMTFQN